LRISRFREPTSGLEPLACSLRGAVGGCQAFHGLTASINVKSPQRILRAEEHKMSCGTAPTLARAYGDPTLADDLPFIPFNGRMVRRAPHLGSAHNHLSFPAPTLRAPSTPTLGAPCSSLMQQGYAGSLSAARKPRRPPTRGSPGPGPSVQAHERAYDFWEILSISNVR
jgi:hypothetical protein